jgi:hypothetical protein
MSQSPILFRPTAAVFLCGVLAAALLSGCATPQAALDQANNGAALTQSLQAELQQFRTLQISIAKARMESVRRQQAVLASYEAESAFDERVLKLAGKNQALGLYASLKELADSRIRDEQALTARLAELDDTLAKLLVPLPEPTAKLNTTQETLAVLGHQLSAQQRLSLAAGFASEIKKAVDDNKKKIDAAVAAASPAPAQGAASVPKP